MASVKRHLIETARHGAFVILYNCKTFREMNIEM